ncbi:MAG: MFS transporter [Solirubrobacteraceae bacterium]
MSPSGSAQAARGAVTAIFALNGVLFGTWAARIPAIRDRVGLSDGELGIVLACIAVGAIAAMPIAGAAGARFGSRRATRVSFAFACGAVGVVALAPSLPMIAVLAVLLGMAMGSLDVSMNAHGVAVESRYDHPILASFHAAFSLGGLAGGALGALAAAAGVDVRVHLALVAAASAAIGLLWSRRFLGPDVDAVGAADPTFVRPPAQLIPLGLLAFACLLIEGASGDWSGVYLRDELGASAGVAALGFTAFSVTMTAGRVIGDRLVERFGSVAVVRAGGAIAAGGFALALLASTPLAAIGGFACLGAGMSGIVPIVFRAAGQVPGMAPQLALAAVSSTGYLGFMVGPPVIGAIAELVGLPSALIVIVLLGGVVFSLAPTTRRAALVTA